MDYHLSNLSLPVDFELVDQSVQFVEQFLVLTHGADHDFVWLCTVTSHTSLVLDFVDGFCFVLPMDSVSIVFSSCVHRITSFRSQRLDSFANQRRGLSRG